VVDLIVGVVGALAVGLAEVDELAAVWVARRNLAVVAVAFVVDAVHENNDDAGGAAAGGASVEVAVIVVDSVDVVERVGGAVVVEWRVVE